LQIAMDMRLVHASPGGKIPAASCYPYLFPPPYYGKSTNVLSCRTAPDDGNPNKLANPPGKADSAWHWTLSTPGFASGYAINKWLAGTGGMANSRAHPEWLYEKDSTVNKPVVTPVFMDSAWINLDPVETDSPAGNLYDALGEAYASSEGMPRVCIARHGGNPPGLAPRNVPRERPWQGPSTWVLWMATRIRSDCKTCGHIIGTWVVLAVRPL
jgi:hypothetical protein